MSMVHPALLVARSGNGRQRDGDVRQFALTEYREKDARWIVASVPKAGAVGSPDEVLGKAPAAVSAGMRVLKSLLPGVGTVGER